MPYDKFTCVKAGKKMYCTRNIETGKIVHYTSEKNRETGMRMREMFSHGFVPSHLRHSKRGRVHSVRGYQR